MQKRLNREIVDIRNKYVDCKIVFLQEDNIYIVIQIFVNAETNYSFKINADYPFKYPKTVKCGTRDYSRMMKLSPRFSLVLERLTGIKCLCCSSFFCANNWTPAITILRIIQEIERNRNVFRRIVRFLLVENLKETYLNRDIDIFQFL